MNDHPTAEEGMIMTDVQGIDTTLFEPLAAVVHHAVRTTPATLGDPRGVDDLVGAITANVAVYVQRHVLPANALERARAAAAASAEPDAAHAPLTAPQDVDPPDPHRTDPGPGQAPSRAAAGGVDRPPSLPCAIATLGHDHDAHDWVPQPGMPSVRCGGFSQVTHAPEPGTDEPAPQLRDGDDEAIDDGDTRAYIALAQDAVEQRARADAAEERAAAAERERDTATAVAASNKRAFKITVLCVYEQEQRADAAEAERDRLRAERAELIRQRDTAASDTVRALADSPPSELAAAEARADAAEAALARIRALLPTEPMPTRGLPNELATAAGEYGAWDLVRAALENP